MWRTTLLVARGLRGPWNSSVVRQSQNVYREDPADSTLVCRLDRHIVCTTRTHAAYRYSQSDSGHEGHEWDHRGGNTDGFWDEWLRSIKQDLWAHSRQKVLLEAVGLGTVYLLGYHLSEYYRLFQSKHINRCCKRLSSLIPSQSVTSLHLGESRLVENETDASSESDDKQISSDSSYSCHQTDCSKYMSKWIHELKICDQELHQGLKGQAVRNEDIATDDLSEGRNAWFDFNERYKALSRNAEGCQFARAGNFQDAIKLWQKSPSLASSCYNMGLCYEFGLGTAKDMNKAVINYEAAVTHGHSKAMYNLALIYLHGNDHIQKNTFKATLLLKKAAQLGVERAKNDLGVLLAAGVTYSEESARLFQDAAKNGDIHGLYNLALCYQFGYGVESNHCKAANLLKRAADGGLASAQYTLGTYFMHGLAGLPKDPDSAESWFESARHSGYFSDLVTGNGTVTPDINLNKQCSPEHRGLTLKGAFGAIPNVKMKERINSALHSEQDPEGSYQIDKYPTPHKDFEIVCFS